MTTNDNNKEYVLTRTDAASGVTFANGSTRFWTDGKTVEVEGTRQDVQRVQVKAQLTRPQPLPRA